jgi:hypothetical protein
MPDPAKVREGVFCEGEAELLGDGQAPWTGFAAERRSALPDLERADVRPAVQRSETLS